MRKIIVGIAVVRAVMLLYTAVGHAADKPDFQGMTVTVDQIVTVTDQLNEHESDAEMLANMAWNECRGVKASRERAAVMWTVLNRVDDERWPDTIAEVITQRNQFAYTGKPTLHNEADRALYDEADRALYDELLSLARDVLMRWLFEKQGVEDVGRVLPREYVFFAGHGGHNWFRTKSGGRYWAFGLPDPYETSEEVDG